jgi:DNA polymerase-4
MDASGFREAFWTRPLESLWGLGSRTIHSLRDLGMATIGDLGKTDPATLAPYFGDRATQLVDLAHGRSGSKVAPPDEEARGPFIHREWNAESPFQSRVKLNRQLSHLVDALSTALQREHRLAERIEVAVVWNDFCKTIRHASLDFAASDRAELYPWAEALFRRFDLGGGVRALGVTAARLSPAPARAPAPFAFTAPLAPAR